MAMGVEEPQQLLERGRDLARSGELEAARHALEAAVDSRHPEYAPQAAYIMATQAEQFVQYGDPAGALHWFARIVAGGDREFGSHAAVRVGALLAGDDPEGAAAGWRFAADHASAEVAAAATNNLTLLAQHTGRPVRTEPSSVAEVYGRATLGRGRLLLNAGDLPGASRAFEEAVPCPHPDVSVEALVHLGASRAMLNDNDAALDALERAVDSAHPHWAPLAAIDVAELLWDRGETAHAVELLRWSAGTGHPTAAGNALARLEALGEATDAIPPTYLDQPSAQAGWPDGANEPAQPAPAPSAQPAASAQPAQTAQPVQTTQPAQNAQPSPTAQPDDGLVLLESGPQPDDPGRAGAEALQTGRRLLQQGDLTSALRFFEQAIDTGHPLHAPDGAAHVAHAFWQREGMDGAETGIDRLADNGFPELAARGWFFLGKHLVASGRFDDAELALQKAAEMSGDAQPAATCSLWVLDSDLSNAEAVFGETMERTPDLASEVVGLALAFGNVLRGQNDIQSSRTAYELAFHLAQRTGDERLVADTRNLLTG